MDDLPGYQDDERWVAFAAHVEPLAPPAPQARPHRKEARQALALAILGVLGFGLVASPLALALGQRASFALAAEQRHEDAGTARAAIALGKLGLALHLAIAVSVLPWLLFALPLLYGAGH